MFERFSDEARRTVVRALVEARMLGHGYVGTEHTLIALACSGSTSAALAVEGVTVDRARVAVADVVGPDSASMAWDEGPYTARARHTFELSLREAFGLDHHYVANGHLLLGLLRLGQGNGLRALESLGVDIGGLQRKVALALDTEGAPPPPPDRRAISTGQRLAIKQPAEVDLRDAAHLASSEPSSPAATFELPAGDDRAAGPEALPVTHACSFCDSALGHGDRFVAGATARICVECVRASARLLGVMDALRQDFTLVFDSESSTGTLSMGTSPPAGG